MMNSTQSDVLHLQSTFNVGKRTTVSDFAEIRESATGEKSLYSTARFEPDQIIARFQIQETLSTPNYLSIQHNEQAHLMLTPRYLHCINHSCTPNVAFDLHSGTLICLRPIDIGEEFTFFYPSTEWEMIQPFECLCNSPACLKSIQGAAHLPIDRLQHYQLSRFIQQKLTAQVLHSPQNGTVVSR